MPTLPLRSLAVPLFAAGLAFGCAKPQPPTVKPVSIRATAVSPERLKLAVELDVHNPNSFPLAVQNVTGILSLDNGATLGAASAEPRTTLPSQASTAVTLDLEVPWQNLAALAPFALAGTDVPYRFDGTAKLGGERLNTDVSFKLDGKLTRAQVIELGLRGLGGQ
jgi:LEA14-like dessication related protein